LVHMQEYGWATNRIIFSYTGSPEVKKIAKSFFWGWGATFLTDTVYCTQVVIQAKLYVSGHVVTSNRLKVSCVWIGPTHSTTEPFCCNLLMHKWNKKST